MDLGKIIHGVKYGMARNMFDKLAEDDSLFTGSYDRFRDERTYTMTVHVITDEERKEFLRLREDQSRYNQQLTLVQERSLELRQLRAFKEKFKGLVNECE